MKEGTLHKTETGWIIRYDQVIHTPVGTHDYKVVIKEVDLEVHSDHNLWLLIFGKDGLPVCFEIESSLEQTARDVARLKACYEFTTVYSQD